MSVEINNLKESNDFLNILLDSINSAVFIVDRDRKIHSFNDAFKTLFDSPEDQLLGHVFGDAIGCEYAISTGNACGNTPFCSNCVLKECTVRTFADHIPTYKRCLRREFRIGGDTIIKYFQFSTKHLRYNDQDMVVIVLDDITEPETARIQLDEDLKAAAEIQRSLLPASPPKPDLMDVAWHFRPCARVGGDIFNIFPLDDSHWGFYMIDVSGHGVSSAMIAVSVSQMLQPHSAILTRENREAACGRSVIPPARVLDELNREYPFERFESFFSITYMVIDSLSGELRYATAGHPSPLVARRDGIIEYLRTAGPVIGMDTDHAFPEGEIMLDPGDRLFIYTDGIPEYQNSEGQFFGRERMVRLLNGSRGPGGVRETVGVVMESLADFGGGVDFQDDISLLALEYKGNTRLGTHG